MKLGLRMAAVVVVAFATTTATVAPTASANDPEPLVQLTQDGWWNGRSIQLPVVGAVVGPLLGRPASADGLLPQYGPPPVPPDAIAVASAVTDSERVAAIGIYLTSATATITDLRLTLQQAASGTTGNLAAAHIVACPITAPWVSTVGGDETQQPSADCSLAKATGTRSDDGHWTFDLTPMLSLWQDPANALAPNGVLLRSDPSAAPPSDFQVTFGDLSTGTARVELTVIRDPAVSSDAVVELGSVAAVGAPDQAQHVPAAQRDPSGSNGESTAVAGATTNAAAAPVTGEAVALPLPVVDVAPLDATRAVGQFRLVPIAILLALFLVAAAFAARAIVRRMRAGARYLHHRGAVAVVVAVILVVPPSGLVQRVNVAMSRVVATVASPLIGSVPPLPDLPPSTHVLDRDGHEIGGFTEAQRVPVRFSGLPAHVWQAVLAAEDATFFDHAGIDPSAMARAVVRTASGTTQGGSTIVQQLVKLNYLDPEQSVLRKLAEIPYAVQLDEMFSKEELLERYLNQVYFGDGAYGIGAAAIEYFGVTAEQLNPAQAALLAGKIRSPGGLDPRRNTNDVLSRRNQVLDLMRDSGWLNTAELDHWRGTAMAVRADDPGLAAQPSHFVQYVRREVADLDRRAAKNGALVAALESGGYTIETTLDRRALEAAHAAAAQVLGAPGDPTVGIASVEPGDGAIRVLLGGLDPGRDFDVATQGYRGAGSTLAPLSYVAALEYGEPFVDDATLQEGPSEAVRKVAARLGIPNIAAVSPLELTAAYAALAAEGTFAQPYAISRILDQSGHLIYQHDVVSGQVIEREVALAASAALEAETTELPIGRPLAGKAGLNLFRSDAWFAGYTPQLATVVWVGVPECMVAVPGIDREADPRADATFTPAAVFSSYVAGALEGTPIARFTPPAHPIAPTPLAIGGTLPSVDPSDPQSIGVSVGAIRAGVVQALRYSTATSTAVAVDIDGLGLVVDINGSRPQAPASTQKLYVASTALLRLGADHRFRTAVRATSPVTADGAVAGDLVLSGSWDPTLTGADLAGLAAAVAGSGIRRVTGNLFVDAPVPAGEAATGGIKGDADSLPPLSPLVVDRNRWRCDDAFRSDPAIGNGERFEALLARAGVVVDGSVRHGPTPDSAVDVAVHDSAPLAEVAKGMLRSSDSFAAEMLLRAIGRSVGSPDAGHGLEALTSTAGDLGLDAADWHDGSGLSPADRDTALHQVAWLKRLESTDVTEPFHQALAVGCESGTLKRRYCGTAAAGRVRAKTGTLRGTINLAGYTDTASGQRVRFSFLLSGVRSKVAAQQAVDSAVTALAGGGAPVFNAIPTNKPEIFLTIDDGWVRDPRIVELVQRLRLPLTVFPTSEVVAQDPAYWTALQSAGAAVHNHTVSHPSLVRLSYEQQKAEICNANGVLASTLGHAPTLLRPPYGGFNEATRRAVAACGLNAIVMWSAEMNNGNLTAVDDRLQRGDIVLLHFGEHLYDDLTRVLEMAAASGLSIGNLHSELSGGFPAMAELEARLLQ